MNKSIKGISMQKELNYTSSIKDMPLMFCDIKRTALLLCEGKSSDEIMKLAMEENIYQLDKPKRRREVPQRMIKRLSTIGQPLVAIIAHGNAADARLISFFAFIKADRLLFEFMHEVYSDKYQTGHNEITDKDFMDFLERKAQNSEIVAKWSAKNLASIRSTIKNVLCDAGMAKRSGDNLVIQRPIVDDSLYTLFDETDNVYARAMLMEV